MDKRGLTQGYVHAVEPSAWSRYAIETPSVEKMAAAAVMTESEAPSRIALMSVSGACYYKTGISKNMLAYFYALEWSYVLEELEALVQDPNVSSVIIDMDSPGGAVFGTPEAAAKMKALSGKKKIVVYANPGVFSAAYWVASQASELYVLPSGYVGSIGTLIVHQDFSGYYSDLGITTTVIKTPDRKAETNSMEPLTEGARKRLEADAERIYEQFVTDVATGRNVSEDYVRKNFGQGGVLNSEEALRVGAVDGIITLEDLVVGELDRASGQTAQNETRNINLTNLNKVKLELVI